MQELIHGTGGGSCWKAPPILTFYFPVTPCGIAEILATVRMTYPQRSCSPSKARNTQKMRLPKVQIPRVLTASFALAFPNSMPCRWSSQIFLEVSLTGTVGREGVTTERMSLYCGYIIRISARFPGWKRQFLSILWDKIDCSAPKGGCVAEIAPHQDMVPVVTLTSFAERWTTLSM